NSTMFPTSISATSVQYRSAQTSVMIRILGMPTLALSFAIARNFSTKGRTFPGLQYMISRMRSMRVLPCVGWVQAAAGRLGLPLLRRLRLARTVEGDRLANERLEGGLVNFILLRGCRSRGVRFRRDSS